MRHDYCIGMPKGGVWRERLNTDATEYGGSGIGNAGKVEATDTPLHGRQFSARLVIPPLATIVLMHESG